VKRQDSKHLVPQACLTERWRITPRSNVDAILQAILGRGKERFGMAAAVLRGECIIAHGVAGVRKRGTAERITLNDRFHLGS
jgi:hypothetical protein